VITSPPPPPVFVEHPARPTWGRCLIVAERDGKVKLQCQDGQEHAIALTHKHQLVTVTPSPDEIDTLLAQIQGHRNARAAHAAKKKSSRPAVPKAPRLNFEQQLERWTTLQPSAFTGAQDAAIAEAQTRLSQGALSGADAFTGVQALVAATTLLHPMEGQIPLRAVPAEHHASIAAALRELLHGSGDYAPRFEAFVAAFGAARAEGSTQKGPSWPLMTLLPALYAPSEHAFVKPKLFQEQAKILGVPIDYVSLPNGAVYEQFRSMMKTLSGTLRENGQSPRDLFDVAAFVSTTLAVDKSAAPADVAPPSA
jgi:hypothetical protein